MPHETSQRSVLIYVVDDDPHVGELVSVFLNSAGYRTQVFQDPNAALEALSVSNPKPDLLVTDFRMPGLNGLELIRLCKEQLPGLKTLSLSATLTTARLQEDTSGPDITLPKPFRPGDLLEAVKGLLPA